jgi:hypothetical protein
MNFSKFRYTQGSPDEAYEKVKEELNLNVPKKKPVPEIVVNNVSLSILFVKFVRNTLS